MPPDEIDNISDEAAIEAELARLKQGQPAQPPEGADTGIPVETPAPVEKPPVIEVKPEGSEPAPAEESPKPEPKPEPKPISEREQQYASVQRKKAERLERDLAAANAELERLRVQTKPVDTAKPKERSFDEEPAEYLKENLEGLKGKVEGGIDELRAEIRRLRDERAQADALSVVVQQEQDFARDHTDYWDARKDLEDKIVEEWEYSGLAAANVNQLKQAVDLGRQGNPQYKGYAQHLDTIAKRQDVQEQAEREGRDVDDVAAFVIARDTYLVGERQKVVAGAHARNKNPAEVAYELAKRRGYQPKSERQTEPVNSGDAARQRVLQARQITEATRSLSESSTGEGAAPGPRVIRNRNDVLGLDESQLDALIESGRYKEL